MKITIVQLKDNISEIENNTYIHCKEIKKGLMKKDFTPLGVSIQTFENILSSLESKDLSFLESTGLDSVLFGVNDNGIGGQILIGQRRNLKIVQDIQTYQTESKTIDWIESKLLVENGVSCYFDRTILENLVLEVGENSPIGVPFHIGDFDNGLNITYTYVNYINTSTIDTLSLFNDFFNLSSHLFDNVRTDALNKQIINKKAGDKRKIKSDLEITLNNGSTIVVNDYNCVDGNSQSTGEVFWASDLDVYNGSSNPEFRTYPLQKLTEAGVGTETETYHTYNSAHKKHFYGYNYILNGAFDIYLELVLIDDDPYTDLEKQYKISLVEKTPE